MCRTLLRQASFFCTRHTPQVPLDRATWNGISKGNRCSLRSTSNAIHAPPLRDRSPQRSGQPLAGFSGWNVVWPFRPSSFSRLFRRRVARSPCPSLLACAVAAGLLRNPRLRASAAWSNALETCLAFHSSPFQLHTSAAQPPSMPFAIGRHPGAAAIIRPIVHDRAAFGL